MHNALKKMAGFSFERAKSLEKTPAALEEFSALVLYYHHKTLSDLALRRLDDFVRGGGGVLALHAATASFKGMPAYFDILGGRFIGHGRVEAIEVQQVKEVVFGGIGDFVVRDELYLHESKPGIEVHFAAMHGGREVPVVWTHRHGRGRVCYAVPGHTSAAMGHPAYQELLRRGLKWACSPENGDQ